MGRHLPVILTSAVLIYGCGTGCIKGSKEVMFEITRIPEYLYEVKNKQITTQNTLTNYFHLYSIDGATNKYKFDIPGRD